MSSTFDCVISFQQNRINGVNHIVWQLEDISRDLLPAGDSLVESLAAKDALRGAPATAAAGAGSGAASAGGGSVESAELKRKKNALLDAMFKGHGCRPVFSSFGYS